MSLDSLVLFRDFLEDNRTSMEVYSDNLESALKPITGDLLMVNSYAPSIPDWLFKCKLPRGVRIRYARYFSYPNQAKKNQGIINHIVDQSYAHLLNAIDSKRTVITVHDLIPILAWKGVVPGLSYPHFPLLFKLTVASLSKARAIIAVSNSTKEDLITHCGLSASNITVVHNGIDTCFRSFSKEKSQSLRSRFRFPDENTYVVLITGNQSYKNHLTSFQVVSKLESITNKSIQLVWLGADYEMCEKYSADVVLTNDVILLKNLNLDKLVELYNSVDCLLFPSWYEGFGLPPLEAMACGTPVVTSNVASIPEVVGDAAIMLPPDDVDGLAVAVKNILENKVLRNEYIERGLKNVKNFTWEQCASDVLSVYKEIINETI
jgi:glycosyltransferase involved in cell wall biosynthesis